jgi:hypothetical protein
MPDQYTFKPQASQKASLVLFIASTAASTTKIRKTKNLTQTIRSMYVYKYISQYMLGIFGVLQCVVNAFDMHMLYVLEHLRTHKITKSQHCQKPDFFKRVEMVV